ncbi:hypothetical protein ANCCAN_12878 [Ancylostoma caninum]|uniref:Uncharacterized protein n=1 Tax=Ancylostoma caninum TaxID=29170 RepID=A0A368G9Q7_ANCCA|nr:hypothetical protein ANCCAN_12878 [Ancylostoma caninum]
MPKILTSSEPVIFLANWSLPSTNLQDSPIPGAHVQPTVLSEEHDTIRWSTGVLLPGTDVRHRGRVPHPTRRAAVPAKRSAGLLPAQVAGRLTGWLRPSTDSNSSL